MYLEVNTEFAPLINAAIEMAQETQTLASQHTISDNSHYFLPGTHSKKVKTLYPDESIDQYSPPKKWIKIFRHYQVQGPIIINDNLSYVGQTHQGQPHGYGKLISKTSPEIFEGFFFKSVIHGPGKMIFAKGQVCQGFWFYGKILKADFYDYKGRLFLTVDIPTIEMPSIREEKQYFGGMENNKRNGQGKYLWEDGTYYQGEFKGGKIEGYGEMVYNDGKQYKGYWKNSKMDGFGQFEWPDGSMYLGNYKEDKKHGVGMFYKNGRSIVSEFSSGSFSK